MSCRCRPGAKPWTLYIDAARPHAATPPVMTDGLSATCEPADKRGWERRCHHVDLRRGPRWQARPMTGRNTTSSPRCPCGRGPHKMTMNPYDPERHVWVFDDQLHAIWKFTYDGKLVMMLGTMGKRGRDGGQAVRPAHRHRLAPRRHLLHQRRLRRHPRGEVRQGRQVPDGLGRAPKDPDNPGPNEFNTVHSIQISNDRRLFVVDRGHRRFQISTRTASSSTCSRPASARLRTRT